MSIHPKKLTIEKAAEIIKSIEHTKHQIGVLTIYLCDESFAIVMCNTTGEVMLIN